MAKALQCPSCGTKKRLDGLATDTFRCENCGQVLKVPPVARPAPGGGSPSPPPRGGAAAPPPRRRPAPPDSSPEPPGRPPRPAPAAPPVVASPSSGPPGGTVVFPAGGGPAVPPAVPARGGGKPPRGGGKPPRDALPLTVRVGAWVLAVPIGLAIIGVPARILGYLTSQKLLDVIVKHNLSRFVPLLVIVVLWALATTVLVELFVEGGRWLMLRRRRRSGGPDGADEIDPGPVPPRPSSRSRRPAGARRS
jgi:hypothetical protein